LSIVFEICLDCFLIFFTYLFLKSFWEGLTELLSYYLGFLSEIDFLSVSVGFMLSFFLVKFILKLLFYFVV